MKVNNLRDLKLGLEKGLSSVYLIVSTDEFDRKKVAESILEKASKEVLYFDAENMTPPKLTGELEGMSLFSKQKCIVVREGEKLRKDMLKLFEAYFDNVNPDICLIIIASKVNRATNFYKKAAKVGVVVDFADVKAWEKENLVMQWIMETVIAQSKNIRPEACQYLVKGLGCDKTLLYHELQKIFCYVGEKHAIELNDVRSISSALPLENIWQLKEALWQRDAARALRIGRSMQDEVLLVLLAQLRTQFQTGLHVASLRENRDNISKAFPYMRGRILENNISMVRGYGLERFKSAVQLINKIELECKNGAPNEGLLLEKLILELVK
jgi:DNA polymerase III subunit delta